MRGFILLFIFATLLFVAAVDAKRNARPNPPARSPLRRKQECQFTRDQVLKCFEHYIDTNHDGRISRREYDYGRNHYLASSQKQIVMSTDAFLHRCDLDRDGRVTQKEFEKNGKTCYHDCKPITDFIHYICAPAQHEKRNADERRRNLIEKPRNIKHLPQFGNTKANP